MSEEETVRLRISLEEIEPEIWRRVEVPLSMPLKGIHDVIQAAFGWEDYHLFEFRVGENSTASLTRKPRCGAARS